MFVSSRRPVRGIALALALGTPLGAHCQFSNGQAAAFVLGQGSFTTSASSPTSLHYWGAQDVAIDTRTGKAFVIDIYASRILRYADVDSLALGAAPEAVLGQTNLNTGGPGTSVTQLSTPGGLALDGAGALWVADTGNHRVLRFDHALTAANGARASAVLGQAGFTTADPATTIAGMSSPKALCIDKTGTLWVADTGNNRVLRFASAASKANGADADGVLGQSGFTASGTGSNASGMNAPSGVCADSAGHLWVADTINARVLRFDHAATEADLDGSPADHVLGQPDLNGGFPATTQRKLSSPENLDLDSTGALAVSDTNNKRCLLWAHAASLGDYAPATTVLGARNFDTQGGGTTATTFGDPHSAKFDAAGRLWLVDSSARRVLRFDPATLAANAFQPGITVERSKHAVTFRIANLGPLPARFRITGATKARREAGVRLKIKWKLDGANVSAQLRAGNLAAGPLLSSDSAALVCQPKRRGEKTGRIKLKISLSVSNSSYPSHTAGARASLKL
jgi:sugar lactone lactonase YvrE